MPSHDALPQATALLVATLHEALTTLPTGAGRAVAHDLQEPIAPDPPTLAVFLYEIGVDAHARNQRLPGAVASEAPTELLLRYLLVPHAAERAIEQAMLGRVLDLFQERPVLEGDRAGGIARAVASPDPIGLEMTMRLWQSLRQPYRLCACYQLRVTIAPEEARDRPPVGRKLPLLRP